MGTLQKPENFKMEELFLDVSLRTCKLTYPAATEYDFTGRKTFDVRFYRQNIGFGITDIAIDINTSLQPSIDITFKDLYGNTLFGTQRAQNDSIDSSVLFDWPPPKFIFSFKGYLGRKVTWLLNLKTTNVSYVPSDGSYEVKCSFVPNQWGFLSDIPILYLLACKKLRYEAYGNENETKEGDCVYKSDSIFSYIRAGKMVDVKTTEETKNFDLLLKQMGSLKYGASAAFFGTKIIQNNEEIKGVVNNVEVQGFKDMMISVDDYENLANEYLDTSKRVKLDALVQFNIRVKKNGSYAPITIDDGTPQGRTKVVKYSEVTDAGGIKNEGSTAEVDSKKIDGYKRQLLATIDENILAIENEIKRRIYSSSKTQISKLTIGEVFRQIARDSGFVLGSILKAGFDGYRDNKAVRDAGRKEIIGQCFPLFINDKGEEVPAVEPTDAKNYGNGPSTDYGVKTSEMAFVDRFIGAIGEGIVENLANDDIAAAGDGKIAQRINNLEAIRSNPYKPYYSNIAENILIRSGIMAYITRSSDPSRPGDYGKNTVIDKDSSDEISSLAGKDIESNLTKDILSQLTYEENLSLKRFCLFFDLLISDDGKKVKSGIVDKSAPAALNDTEIGDFDGDGYTAEYTNDGPGAIPDKLMNYTVYPFGVTKKPVTLRQIVEEVIQGQKKENKEDNADVVIPPNENESKFVNTEDKPVFYNSQINKETLTAKLVVNNGLYWTIPIGTNFFKLGSYFYILFDKTNDSSAVMDVNASVTDATSDEQIEGEGFWTVANRYPYGFIPIDKWHSSFDTESTAAIVNLANFSIRMGTCMNYSKCNIFHENTETYLQKNTIQSTPTVLSGETVPAKGLAFAVYMHEPPSDDVTINVQNNPDSGTCDLVFGPFVKDDIRARNQRAAIKRMCNLVLKKLDEIEVEKNEVLSSIFGKAGEARYAIYKQMHTIFHQWQIIASSITGKKLCENADIESKEWGRILEQEYGSCENHQEKGDGSVSLKELGKDVSPDNKVSKTLFVYDYPLASVRRKSGNKVNVQKSIINIEPLYKPNANTTVLNIIQQICTKNNFMFVPFPGDANSDKIDDIYKPHPTYAGDDDIRNYFHVIFTPTPETRTKLSNNEKEMITDGMDENNFQNSKISIDFGGINNQIIKNINVGTDSTKPTAESILNLQRLVDKENSNHQVSMDCSMLPVYEGRSYVAKVDMLGNSQVYPMQYFYINKMPMFGGLYQIMKVNHTITPNDMSTSIEGIRMRFDTNTKSYGGIPPITLDDFEMLGGMEKPMEVKITSTNFGTQQAQDIYEEITSGPSEDSNMRDILTVQNIKTVLAQKGYSYFPGKVNIIGVRAKTGYTNKFDDALVVIFPDPLNFNIEKYRIYNITTDPGKSQEKKKNPNHKPHYTKYVMNNGIAVMAEGQYLNSHTIGYHHWSDPKKRYEALVQCNSVKVYREKWPENGYVFSPDTLTTGIFGVNIHRSGETYVPSTVDDYSEGCQVFAKIEEFKQLMEICRLAKDKLKQEFFTYTLINKRDFDNI